jgi:DNA-binding NarL/FixJ family response regulator
MSRPAPSPRASARIRADPDSSGATGWHDAPVRRPSVLIVDDHEAFRQSARDLLEAEGFEVVGTSPDGRAAISATAVLGPDVVVLDIHLPGIDGFAVATELAALPRPPAVVLTSSRAASSFGALIDEAPVRGFLAKHELSGAALAAFLA